MIIKQERKKETQAYLWDSETLKHSPIKRLIIFEGR